MPELPEVETVRRGLRIKIVGKRISLYQQFRKDLRWLIPPNIKQKIEGATIISIDRRGKFLLINLNVYFGSQLKPFCGIFTYNNFNTSVNHCRDI
mgnify:CR=1 FL=1